MSRSWADEWKNAETRITTWLASELGVTLGKNAYTGEIPKDFVYTEKNGMFSFAINGGDEPLDFAFNMDEPGNSATACNERRMEAEFEGVWSSREDAQRVAGKLMDIMPPAEYTVNDVRRIRMPTQPRIERATFQAREDQATGGEVRVWRVTCTLLVLFRRETT